MTKQEAIAKLEANKNERGIQNWKKLNYKGISSFGLGLTQIKKIGKEVGKNHELSMTLWDSDNIDVKTLAIIIEEPKKVSREQVESQLKELHFWMLTHTYCSVMLPKVKFALELIDEWYTETDDLKRRCAYLLIYQIAKDNKKLSDSFFERFLPIIEKSLQTEENFVKDAMNMALLMVGQRSLSLYQKSLTIAQMIGKVDVDYGDNSCEAVDCVKHFKSERVKLKLGIV